jgi:hypothetical protein
MVDGLTRGRLFYLTVNSAERQSAIPIPSTSPIRVEYAMEIPLMKIRAASGGIKDHKIKLLRGMPRGIYHPAKAG